VSVSVSVSVISAPRVHVMRKSAGSPCLLRHDATRHALSRAGGGGAGAGVRAIAIAESALCPDLTLLMHSAERRGRSHVTAEGVRDRSPTGPVAAWVKHQLATERLRDVVTALEAHGVPVVPVKGIVSAYTLYADPAERPMSDVDLRLRIPDFQKAIWLARKLGWPAVTHTPRLWEAEIGFRGCPVELEASLGPPGLCAIRIDEVLERSTLGTRFGFPCREPALHDHALILCINAFKDLLSPPAWSIEDLDRITRLPAFSVDALCDLARRGRVVTAVAIVMAWMQELRGNATCGTVCEALGGPARPTFARGYRWMTEHRVLFPYDSLLVPSVASDSPIRAARGFSYAVYGWLRGGLARRGYLGG